MLVNWIEPGACALPGAAGGRPHTAAVMMALLGRAGCAARSAGVLAGCASMSSPRAPSRLS